MVRFQLKRPASDFEPYFPYYKDPWTSTADCSEKEWKDIWESDAVLNQAKINERDRLHRKNSYYYSREIEDEEDSEDSPTFAIILFGSIIFCLFVPQIIDLLITVFCPGPLPPPSPPTPPPGPKCRKRLRLYHYAFESRRDRKRHSSIAGQYYYDPDNILNYVSATRIKTLKDINGEDADDELDMLPNEDLNRKKKSKNSKTVSLKILEN